MLGSPSHHTSSRRVPPPYTAAELTNPSQTPLNLGRSHQSHSLGQSPIIPYNRSGIDQQCALDVSSNNRGGLHQASPNNMGSGGGGANSFNSANSANLAMSNRNSVSQHSTGINNSLLKETKATHRRDRRAGGGSSGHQNDEVVEVQILPQDDNWGDNTTCITGATSERSISAEDISRLGLDGRGLSGFFLLHMWLGSVIAALLSVTALLSPLAMLLIPKLPIWDQPWKIQACGPECDGLLISFAFKLAFLSVACWALFFRRPRATMPRIFVFRAVFIVIIVVILVCFWLFYSVRIYEKRYEDFDLTYLSIVQFADSLIISLLCLHYIFVLLLEIRHLQPQYFVKVVRSPDGASKCYSLGAISIQRAAVQLLENYYRDFPVYNPFLEQLPVSGSSKKHSQSFKVYDLNGAASQTSHTSVQSGGNGRRTTDRLYAEHEYEKRVRKRRARLVTAAEEAFTHIKRVRENTEPSTQLLMDSQEAAQAVFPSMARALQKYLRITRQQPRHTMQGILEHLSSCLHYDLSPKTFLEKYLKSEPVLQDERELSTQIQSWALVCDVFLSRPIKSGLTFILRQGDVSLMATVSDLPHLNITEEVVDPKCNRFVLRLQSETSV